MKFHWGLLGLLSVLLLSSPAQAGRLLFWRFEEDQNRLTFSTDESVQPTAQLISDPTRLIIDLPGTRLGRPSINQGVGGAIAGVRIGQFDAQTTRIVIELTPGYALDPEQIQIRGINPTQWSVELPTPTRATEESGAIASAAATRQPTRQTRQTRAASSPIQATGSGFYVRLGDEPEAIDVRRSEDRRSIDIALEGVTLPAELAEQTLPVGRYGLRQVQFSQTSDSEARLTLDVNEDSPDWWVSSSRLGGLVLVPVGGVSAVPDNGEDSGNEENPTAVAQNNIATIESIDLGISGSQLLIKTDRSVRFRSQQLAGGVQQILIPNARLGSNVSSRLPTGRSLSRLRAQQLDSNTVAILMTPRSGFQVGGIMQRNARLLTVDLQPVRTALPPPSARIPVPPPDRTNPTPATPTLPTVPAGRVLVVIDPGHGGRDPGAVGIGGLREKDVILPISLEVARLLEQQGASVLLTRETDYFVSLEGRTQIANRARGTLFVSIHANAASRAGANGVETFYFSSGRGLATAIQNSIIQNFDTTNRGVKQARFFVLRNTSMPSALVEVGFVTGTEDSPQLRDPNYRSRMAAAIAQGILNYIQQRGL